MSHLESQMESIVAYIDAEYHGLSLTAIRNVMKQALDKLDRQRRMIERLEDCNKDQRRRLIEEQEGRADAEAAMAKMRRDLIGDGDT